MSDHGGLRSVGQWTRPHQVAQQRGVLHSGQVAAKPSLLRRAVVFLHRHRESLRVRYARSRRTGSCQLSDGEHGRACRGARLSRAGSCERGGVLGGPLGEAEAGPAEDPFDLAGHQVVLAERLGLHGEESAGEGLWQPRCDHRLFGAGGCG